MGPKPKRKATRRKLGRLGRPSMGVQRYNVTLAPAVAEHYRSIGGGNLSAGIAKAAEPIADIRKWLTENHLQR